MRQLLLAMRLRERALFDSFVAGDNQMVVQQLQAFAHAAPRGILWLAGAHGVGKSHLLQAVCAQASSAGAEAAYLPLSQLRVQGPEMLEGWQQARIVALDDVTAVAGELAWERALFRLQRELDENGGALLVAAVEPPRALPFALPDLASRLAAATLLTLRALDETQQREALRLRAHARGLILPEETALYLQRRFRRDLPTLYDLFDTLEQAALEAQRRLTVPFIRQVLAAQGSHEPE